MDKKIMNEIRTRNPKACLIDIFGGENWNENYQVIGAPGYEKILYQKDNKLNPEGKEFIGSSYSTKL